MEQRLTPQLIQSMSILQKPVTELEAYIAEALERNAALEIEEPQAEQTPSNGKIADRTAPTAEETGFARLEQMSRDYRDLDMDWLDGRPSFHRRATSDERDPKIAAMANTAGRDADLNEHLSEQWALLDLDDEVRRAGEAIINNIDPDGYLRTRFDTIAERTKPPVSTEAMEVALRHIHQLEPAGIGARDVIECLLLQLDALPGDNSIERTLIKNHLDDITHNRLPAVARATGYSTGEIAEAIKAMRHSLCLHPGYLVGNRTLPPIRPDVIVEYSGAGGGLEVHLARGNAPRLKISEDVASLARSKQNGKETREFAKKQVEEASALIDAVTFRRSRLLEVARAIIEKQREFFDAGPQGLKVLRMSDLAAELSCDPSTISRTVAEKYMQTPRGIYPLRYFFTGGTENDEGESIGWDRVKDRVREAIEAEDKSDPLNDDQVADLLKKEGIEISRRTVAKYRAQLNIPSARQRKSY
jgi:RNA polymerase sigma-54 factor